jgi:hypothetical protein
MLKPIGTTIIGGIIFLISVAIFVAVIGQGLKFAGARSRDRSRTSCPWT